MLAPANRIHQDAKSLHLVLTVNSYGGVAMSLLLAGFMAMFASDAPTSTKADAVMVFCIVLPLAWLPLVALPQWAARRVMAAQPCGLMLAVTHSILTSPLNIPLGPALSLMQLYYCARVALDRRANSATAFGA
jgi:hypothetical protein